MVRGRYLSDYSVNMPQISRGSSLDTPLSKSYHGYPMLLPQMLPDCVKHHQATQIWDLLDVEIQQPYLVSPEPVPETPMMPANECEHDKTNSRPYDSVSGAGSNHSDISVSDLCWCVDIFVSDWSRLEAFLRLSRASGDLRGG